MNILVLKKYLNHQNLSRGKIKKYQEKKFYALAKLAYKKSRFYRNSFNKSGINLKNIDVTPIEKFPTINKEIFMENFNDILTIKGVSIEQIRDKQIKSNSKYKIVRSSGSSNKPGYFIYSNKDWTRLEYGLVRMIINSLPSLKNKTYGSLKCSYLAMTKGIHAGALLFKTSTEHLKYPVDLIDINTPIDEVYAKICKFSPNVLVGYSSALMLFANQYQKFEHKPLNLAWIVTCGEPLSKHCRDFLKEVFSCQITNLYSASESLLLGVEYDTNEFYISDDYTLIEVIDGKTYITNLINKAQPLIRYHLTDSITILETDKGFRKMKINECRSEEILTFESSDHSQKGFIYPLLFEDFCYEGLIDYQIIQDRSDHFKVNFISKNKKYEQNIINGLKKEIDKVILDSKMSFITYEINVVDKVDINLNTGKKKLVIGLKNA